MRTLRYFLASGGVVLLAACGGGGTSGGESPSGTVSPPTSAAALDLQGDWVLDSGSTADGDITLVSAAPVTFSVADDGTVTGRSACNQYSTSVTVEGDEVSFGEIASTLMACPDDVMAVESAYLRALGAVDRGAIDGSTLTLSGNGAELVFSAAAES